MCFIDDGDGHTLDVRHARARKQHRCFDCHARIEPGTLYKQHIWLNDGYITDAKLCERCQWLVARLHAEEIAEGCSWHESWPPIGCGELLREYRERFAYCEDEDEPNKELSS